MTKRTTFFIFAMLLAAAGCKDRPVESTTSFDGAEEPLLLPSIDEGGGFFDEALLLDGAVDLREAIPKCVGATEAELALPDHPAIIRGQVLAPSARFARRSFLPDWLVPSAHASLLEGELPVPDVRVALYRQDKAEPVGPALVETRTNSAGAWCLRIPDGVEAGPELILIATTAQSRDRLRRLFVLPGDVDISALSEAFVQLLVEDGIDPASLPKATYLNMEVIANTTVDLIDPVIITEEEGLKETITRIKKSLRQDARFTAILARQVSRD